MPNVPILPVASAAAAFVAVASGAIRALFELPWSRRFRLVRDYEEPLMRRLDILLRLAAVAVWFLFTLRNLDALQPFRAAVEGLLRSHIKVGALDISAGDVVAFGITLWIAVWIKSCTGRISSCFGTWMLSRGTI